MGNYLWKFLRTGMKSQYGNMLWEIGKWQRIDKQIVMCNVGFHASEQIIQAKRNVNGEILAQVEVRGKHLKKKDKQVWSEMCILHAYRWTKRDNVAFAIFAAQQALPIFEQKYSTDNRPRKAIEAAQAWLDNSSRDAAADAADAAADAADAAYAAYAARTAYAAAYAAADAAAGKNFNLKLEQWCVARVNELEEI